jgi:uncharacterized repeat protein (TIGR02543 family)/uncharacterized repeat protein (TIGR01451 family)
MLLACSAPFMHGALNIDMGAAVQTGTYYTYPELTVTAGSPTNRAYIVRVMFTRATTANDKIEYPSVPSGWAVGAGSTQHVRVYDIAAGATAAEVQATLRTVRFTHDPAKKGQAVMLLLGEQTGQTGRKIYYSSDKDSWYEFVAQSGNWVAAYNAAHGRDFLGMKGHLATLTDQVESNFVATVAAGAVGWIGGTRFDINTVMGSDGKLTGIPAAAGLNYWFWADGPEWENGGKNPLNSRFYSAATGGTSAGMPYPYNYWSSGEPNNLGPEQCAHLLLNSGAWNDYSYSNPGVAGFLVEYKGTTTGVNGQFGFDSKKDANIGGVAGNGTSASPVQLVYGDEITYTITAANASDASTAVTVVDEIPAGMEYITGSASNSGSYAAGKITWNMTVATEQTSAVTFKARKSANATGAMINMAKVTSGGVERATNKTYHNGVMCNVSFTHTPAAGGSVTGATQNIDFGLNPNTGITYTANAGYAFDGWSYPAYTSLKSTPEPAGSNITDYMTVAVKNNMTLTANFKEIPYTITLDPANGIVTGPNPIDYTVISSPITLPTPTRTGYTFDGWTGEGYSTPTPTVTIPTGSIGDRTYTAHWTIIPYTINYLNVPPDVANTNKTGYNVETSSFNINALSKPGYNFLGWTGAGVTTPTVPISIPKGSTGNRTYTAHWDTIVYTLKYVDDDGSTPIIAPGAPASYRETELPLNFSSIPIRPAGWTFLGWTQGAGSGSGAAISIPKGTLANQTYKANWLANGYTITFNPNGGVNPSSINPAWLGYKLTTLPISNISILPTRTGYTFTGWNGHGLTNQTAPFSITSSTPGVAGTPGNLTYTAGWTVINYAITLALDGGSVTGLNPIPYTYETNGVTLPTPTRTGYTFTGWTGEGITTPAPSVIIPANSIGNRTYTAHWSLNTYDIFYNLDGGTPHATANPTTYTVTTPTFTLHNPTKAGWNFAGWVETGSLCSPAAPTGTTVTINTGSITGDITYKATWTTVPFTITYNYNGGTAPGTPNPSGYNVTTPVSITQHPAKPGHTFVGWTGSNGAIPQLTVNVPAGTMGNLTYDAKWSFQFANDTVLNCSAPLKIESGNDGLSYVWVLPDGSSRTSTSVQAMTSGNYILHTNYGSMVTIDTVYVLLFFEEGQKINYSSTGGTKVGSIVSFDLPLNKYLTNVTRQWNIPGATPATFTGDTAHVVFNTSGKRTVSVNVTATKGGLTCTKTISMELKVMASRNGFFVDQTAGGTNDGSSWANAYRTIQDALAHAGMNDYIWVAKGAYSPGANAAYLVHYDSIQIVGGFGGWETNLSERDFAKNQTILKGNGNSVIINTNVKGILWDGFIIEGGKASSGGGVHNNKASTVIANSIIRNNNAERGGGVYSGQSNSVLYNVEISGNTAQEGGAMYNNLSNPVTTNVTVSGNKAAAAGGIHNDSSNPQHYNTIIWGNKADKDPNIFNVSSTPGYWNSLIEGSNGNGGWNDAFGTDGAHNLDGNPLFRKNGFGNDGSMTAGNYELYTGSRAVDKGNRSFVYNIKVLSDINLNSLTGMQYSSLPFDLNGHERIANDKVDMGAYEYNASVIDPGILRVVHLPLVEGLTTDLEAGEHTIRSHNDFVFTITARPGYSLDYLEVKTGSPERDKDGVKMVRNEDGSVTVTIVQVTESLNITINGVGPVANNEIDGKKVWAYDNKLYIRTDREAGLKIYTFNGSLYTQRTIKDPETVIALAPGVYTVVVDDKAYKVIIKE